MDSAQGYIFIFYTPDFKFNEKLYLNLKSGVTIFTLKVDSCSKGGKGEGWGCLRGRVGEVRRDVIYVGKFTSE